MRHGLSLSRNMASKKPILVIAVMLLTVLTFFVVTIKTSYAVFFEASETQRSCENEFPPASHQVALTQSTSYLRKEKPPILEPLASRTLGPAGKSPPDEELERIWNYIYYRQYHCSKSLYLGGRKKDGDGAYDLCIEQQFWPFPSDSSSEKCLLYSFGIANDFTFDDAMAKLGCEVHSFDPSISLEDGKVLDSGVTFHKVGIASEDNDSGFKGWKMRTLGTIIKELGHENRTLDYLKVDTDKKDGTGFEDEVMQQLLDSGLHKCIRQYAMEIHMPGVLHNQKYLDRCRYLYFLMSQLNDNGWRLYNTTDNVRFMQKVQDPTYTQRRVKQAQLARKADVIMWETAFVNFDLTGSCGEYL